MTSASAGAAERGSVLIIVLVLVVVLFALGVFGSRGARLETQIARNDYLTKRALSVAEAGLHHAFSRLKASAASFDDELAGGSGVGGGLAAIGDRVTHDGTEYRFRRFGGAGPRDGYYVRVADNWEENADTATDKDGAIRVISRGVVANAERRVEALVRLDAGPECAVNVQDRLDISGSPRITGRKGCTHTNGKLDKMAGNPTIEKGATSGGTMDIVGSPTLEGNTLGSTSDKSDYAATHSSQPLRPIPSVRVFAFGGTGILGVPGTGIDLAAAVRQAGGYLLGDDCKVYRGAWTCVEATASCTGGLAVEDVSKGGKWNGWDCKEEKKGLPSAEWMLTGSSTIDGVFFIEGWAKITGNIGSTASPWRVTLIAMNSIDISGKVTAIPWTTTGDLRSLLFVSGNDLGLSGDLGTAERPAALFAHQQIAVNGNPVIHGFIVAEDGLSGWLGDPARVPTAEHNIKDFNDISGNLTLHYAGLDTAVTPGQFALMSWLDRRN